MNTVGDDVVTMRSKALRLCLRPRCVLGRRRADLAGGVCGGDDEDDDVIMARVMIIDNHWPAF